MSRAIECETQSSPPEHEDECSVCKTVFGGHETVLLKCGHYFHSDCGQQWYRAKHPCTCPLCRADFNTVAHFDHNGAPVPESDQWRTVKQEAAHDRHASYGSLFSLFFGFLATPNVGLRISVPIGNGSRVVFQNFDADIFSLMNAFEAARNGATESPSPSPRPVPVSSSSNISTNTSSLSSRVYGPNQRDASLPTIDDQLSRYFDHVPETSNASTTASVRQARASDSIFGAPSAPRLRARAVTLSNARRTVRNRDDDDDGAAGSSPTVDAPRHNIVTRSTAKRSRQIHIGDDESESEPANSGSKSLAQTDAIAEMQQDDTTQSGSPTTPKVVVTPKKK